MKFSGGKAWAQVRLHTYGCVMCWGVTTSNRLLEEV